MLFYAASYVYPLGIGWWFISRSFSFERWDWRHMYANFAITNGNFPKSMRFRIWQIVSILNYNEIMMRYGLLIPNFLYIVNTWALSKLRLIFLTQAKYLQASNNDLLPIIFIIFKAYFSYSLDRIKRKSPHEYRTVDIIQIPYY